MVDCAARFGGLACFAEGPRKTGVAKPAFQNCFTSTTILIPKPTFGGSLTTNTPLRSAADPIYRNPKQTLLDDPNSPPWLICFGRRLWLPLVRQSPPKDLKIGGVQFRPPSSSSICILRSLDRIFWMGMTFDVSAITKRPPLACNILIETISQP
jgi:hypothetical protein